jgi:hypothetical protein
MMVARDTLRFAARFAALVVASQLFFLAWYALARRIDPDAIVFYGGLRALGYSLAALATMATLAWFAAPGMRPWLQPQLLLPLALIYLLAGYAVVITSSLLDRSISVYLIAIVAQSGERGLAKNELNKGFVRDFVNGEAAVDKRLQEQLASKDIVESNDRFFITERGRFVYDVNRALAKVLRIPATFTEPARSPGEP